MVSPRPSRWLARASQWAATVQVDWDAGVLHGVEHPVDHWLEEYLAMAAGREDFDLFAIAGGENNCTTAVLHECEPLSLLHNHIIINETPKKTISY